MPVKTNVQKHNFTASIRQRYKLTIDGYKHMLFAQNKRCFICKESKKLVIDHDHQTGKVRALLCYDCNNIVGVVENKGRKIIKALDYLKIHKEWKEGEEIVYG